MGTKKVAVANYSDVQVATMTSMYSGDDNVAEVKAISDEIGKPVNSVRAKLSSLGIYKKAEVVKSVSNKVTKNATSVRIAKLTGMTGPETEALEKTTAAVLNKLLTGLTNAKSE